MNIHFAMRKTLWASLASILISSGLLAEDPLRSQLEQVSSLKDFKPAVNDFRIYYIGDSITRHGTNSEILARLQWDHAAGMAASSEDKDYAHLVAKRIGQMLPEKKVKLFFGPGGNAVSAMKGIETAKTFQPALVVVQLGEHVPSKSFGDNYDESPGKIASDYGALLDAVKALPSSPMIICTGSWNPIPGVRKYAGRSAQIDEIQHSVCQQKGVAFVSVEKYALDPLCSGTGNSGGVKCHPNDAGHAGYAKEIFAAFEKLTKEGAAKVGDVVFEKPFNKDDMTWSPQQADWAKFIPDGHGGYYAEITANGQGEAGAIGNRDVFGNIDKSKSSTFLLNANLSTAFE
ncbi:MAG: SGNH/GDSL hydrolase family protein, partial [Prosthecobacter sp.]|nr:SGNH/GDSL hydrolase family protein [Prosthecobacter sp.]